MGDGCLILKKMRTLYILEVHIGEKRILHIWSTVQKNSRMFLKRAKKKGKM